MPAGRYDPDLHKRIHRSWKIDEALAERISELYFLHNRDRKKIGEALDGGRILDEFYLHNPLVRVKIIEKARKMSTEVYTREQHIRYLQKIRDGAILDENWKEALKSEIAVGTAAGLYEKLGDPHENGKALPAPEDMSTDALRTRLSQLQLAAPPISSDPTFSAADLDPGEKETRNYGNRVTQLASRSDPDAF